MVKFEELPRDVQNKLMRKLTVKRCSECGDTGHYVVNSGWNSTYNCHSCGEESIKVIG